MSLQWASVWEAKVSIFQRFCKGNVRVQERDCLSGNAENELTVGFSMGSSSIEFSSFCKGNVARSAAV
eukprot:4220005-Karenia_brevis.AAC.1